MEIGVFIPIGNNGWLLSENAPQYKPSFELNKAITLKAESYGFDFALSMIKLRGFGGKTEFWDYNLESFTLMAGLAAVTSKIKLFGTAATLIMPPAIVARMATTIDSISNGRFGVNLVTGWQRPEYSQMGLWPGDDYFSDRYEYLTEYTTVLKDLLTTGQSDLKGKHFQMDDCRMKPIPEGDVKLICAGSSNSGMAFSAQFADYSFCFGVGVNTPKAFAPTNERLLAATEKTGRDVRSFVLTMVLAEETTEEAFAKWEHYKAGADEEAIKWLGLQSAVDTKSGSDTNVRHMANPVSAVNINMGTLIGSYAEVAAMLDEMSEVPGTGGVMLTFDDFLEGIEKFGKFVQPLMKSRAHVNQMLEAAE
ncbi:MULTISPECIES: pyrimidine utilization protein A [Rhizobium/Agrobacterium group]|uniref:pyrimidine utilization protein A n=1 Tax=Rhizobium/Agrobacterium group TaxID=227290 RepID=UPI0006B954B9|nr:MULTISPECIES: pyrimidine utilization protein A [Rhizobium/Agrobacterium group]AOG09804.1 pyrimidine utilization protein A [Agrobacterium sp. RAC06]KPF57304.1 pyrimidine monooxygenase [Rhizobium sp. AAP116]